MAIYISHEDLYTVQEISEYHGFQIKQCQTPTQEKFRVACFSKQKFDITLVRSVAQLKHLNTSHLHQLIDEQNNNILVIVERDLQMRTFFEYLKYQKFELDIRTFLVLCLTMAEFAIRGIAWNTINFECIKFCDGHVMIDKFEFDFNSKPDLQMSIRNFKKFMLQFPNYGRNIEYMDSYEAIVNFALTKFPNNPKADSTPYFHIVKEILNIQTEQRVSQHGSNSDVYKVQIPTIVDMKFKEILPHNSKYIVIKSTIIPQDQDDLQKTLINILREIELSEQILSNKQFAVSFSYIRFHKQVFLLMPFYQLTLQDLINRQSDEKKKFSYVDLYTIGMQFAEGIYQMHELKILHRDLKPGNLFLSSDQIQHGKILIGDFDRSKSQIIHQKQISEITNLLNTPQYDPPEVFDNHENQTLKVDIWQFGLIMLQLANLGQLHGNTKGSYLVDKYELVYGEEVIKQLLANYQYSQEFLNLICDCLKRNPNERPNALEIKLRAQAILTQQKSKFQIIEQS